MLKKYAPVLIMIICLPLIACSGNESTPPEIPGTAADTTTPEITVDQAPPKSLDTPVSSIDQIVGTWIAAADLGNFVMTIFPDGTLSVATSLVDLENGSTDSWTLTIEDDQIYATGFALCLGDTGSYLAVIKENGTLKFTSIIDACDSRLRKMDRSLPGRLNPYNLIYNRVD